MSATDYQVHGKVAVISMNSPPVNGLGHELRSGILAGLDRANADPAIGAIVLTGTAKAFSGGADIREFNTPKMLAEPNLHTVITAIEKGGKPVVAAISGVCMGGGLELALGCHYRVVAPGAQIALPEVKLGLLPGGGGTQRFPRVVGLEVATNMIVSGATVPAEQLKGTALFDAFIDPSTSSGRAEFLKGAVDFAGQQAGKPLKLVRDLKVKHPEAEAFLQFARNSAGPMAGPLPAPLKCIDAVAASLKPFEEGLAIERRLFGELIVTPESRALRHAFFGERAASKIPDVPEDTPTRPIRTAAVIGAGTMGGGIAMNFANAGIPVAVLETKAEALEKGLATIRRNYESAVRKGKLKQEALEKRMALIEPTLDYARLANADIVIEAVFEDIDVKKAVFEKLDSVMKPGAILASNTSTLDLDRIAAFTRRPQDVIGTHFFSPANVMRLLEVVRGAKTGKDVLATTMQLGKTIKKLPVVSGVCDGFIGNRMINKYSAQALQLLAEGALPQQVDKAIEKFGLAMGPFRMSDLAGNDVGWYIRKRHYAENPQLPKVLIADRLCEQGRYGQKTGSGWYAYKPGDRTAIPDPAVERLILDVSREFGVQRREITDEEIVGRCIYALVNEGARLLDEGIALRASDIDMVYLNGYGFPLHRGGPMLYADTVGLYNVEREMKHFAALPGADRKFWELAPLLRKLAAEGKGFNG